MNDPSSPRHTPTRGLYGWITHTEFASSDPAATRAWCIRVFDWDFKPAFQTPTGDYHLFAYSEKGGGGIRLAGADTPPGSIPFVHVADVRSSFAKALDAGGEVVLSPQVVFEGVGVAIVRAPGGITVGLSGPSEGLEP